MMIALLFADLCRYLKVECDNQDGATKIPAVQEMYTNVLKRFSLALSRVSELHITLIYCFQDNYNRYNFKGIVFIQPTFLLCI